MMLTTKEDTPLRDIVDTAKLIIRDRERLQAANDKEYYTGDQNWVGNNLRIDGQYGAAVFKDSKTYATLQQGEGGIESRVTLKGLGGKYWSPGSLSYIKAIIGRWLSTHRDGVGAQTITWDRSDIKHYLDQAMEPPEERRRWLFRLILPAEKTPDLFNHWVTQSEVYKGNQGGKNLAAEIRREGKMIMGGQALSYYPLPEGEHQREQAPHPRSAVGNTWQAYLTHILDSRRHQIHVMARGEIHRLKGGRPAAAEARLTPDWRTQPASIGKQNQRAPGIAIGQGGGARRM